MIVARLHKGAPVYFQTQFNASSLLAGQRIERDLRDQGVFLGDFHLTPLSNCFAEWLRSFAAVGCQNLVYRLAITGQITRFVFYFIFILPAAASAIHPRAGTGLDVTAEVYPPRRKNKAKSCFCSKFCICAPSGHCRRMRERPYPGLGITGHMVTASATIDQAMIKTKVDFHLAITVLIR